MRQERRAARCRDLQVELAARRGRTRERQRSVDERVEPCADDDARTGGVGARVDRPHRECIRGAAGRGDVAVRRSRAPVVAGGRDDERVERARTGHSRRLGAVGKARERLRERDERDADGVVRVAVAVRVDCAIETGDHLVATREDRPPAEAVGLPSCDANRERSRPRARRRATRPAISVPCSSTRAGSAGLAAGRAPGSPPTTSIPGIEPSAPVSSTATVTPRPSMPARASAASTSEAAETPIALPTEADAG